MSDSIALLPIRASLAGRWQVPALAAGVALLSLGIGRMAADRQILSFDQKLSLAHQLRDADALTRASAYLLELLGREELTPEQRGVVHAELGTVIHRAESRLRRHDARNVSAIISHFEEANRLGVMPEPRQWVVLGDALRWAEQLPQATAAYRQALKAGIGAPDRLRRRIGQWELDRAGEMTPEALVEIDAILSDTSALPSNYLWALERKVESLLLRGDATGAMLLVGAARERLKGTEELLAVSLSEALCLRDAGLQMEAEALLRGLREEWAFHDELWARSGYLLGRLQQEDGRPQAALSYFEEVLRAFREGEVHDQCMLGRAECLATLGRYEGALALFVELGDRARGQGLSRGVDVDSIRVATSTIAELLLQEGRAELAVGYLEVAQNLAPPGNRHLQAHYVSRRAVALGEMALAAANDGESAAQAAELHARSADAYLSLAQLVSLDESAAAAALEQAADHFELAGKPDLMRHALERLAAEYPAHLGRAEALVRLGQLAQAENDLPRATGIYRMVIDAYPRTPQALKSYVPLADCLIRIGGAGVSEGVRLLIDIVDDRGEDPLFSPRALEYRQALFRLADYYMEADEAAAPDRFEQAIARLEDAIAFYPEDPQAVRLRFMLAEAYRASGSALRKIGDEASSSLARADAQQEADRRLGRAMEEYERVIAVLASEDAASLNELEQTRLRASYQYRGDCLFDLGRFAEALVAYREAAWRYENEPGAVVAMVQVVNCHQRLGELEDARAALSRLGWLLKKTPASAFTSEPGMSPKAFWEGLVARLERTGIY